MNNVTETAHVPWCTMHAVDADGEDCQTAAFPFGPMRPGSGPFGPSATGEIYAFQNSEAVVPTIHLFYAGTTLVLTREDLLELGVAVNKMIAALWLLTEDAE